MPAPKKPSEEMEGPEVEALRAELAALREELRSREESPSGTLEQILMMLAEQRQAPQPAEREASLASMGPAGSIMSEAQSVIEPLPESDRPLDYEKVYVSKGRGLKVVYKARRAMADAEGNTWLRPGQHIDFAPNGEFRTNSPEIIEFLEARDSFNREFWDAENIPGSLPDIGAALERVSQYSVDLNLDGLNEMESEERAGLNRQDLMRSIKTAQRQVGLVREKLAKQQVEA